MFEKAERQEINQNEQTSQTASITLTETQKIRSEKKKYQLKSFRKLIHLKNYLSQRTKIQIIAMTDRATEFFFQFTQNSSKLISKKRKSRKHISVQDFDTDKSLNSINENIINRVTVGNGIGRDFIPFQ